MTWTLVTRRSSSFCQCRQPVCTLMRLGELLEEPTPGMPPLKDATGLPFLDAVLQSEGSTGSVSCPTSYSTAAVTALARQDLLVLFGLWMCLVGVISHHSHALIIDMAVQQLMGQALRLPQCKVASKPALDSLAATSLALCTSGVYWSCQRRWYHPCYKDWDYLVIVNLKLPGALKEETFCCTSSWQYFCLTLKRINTFILPTLLTLQQKVTQGLLTMLQSIQLSWNIRIPRIIVLYILMKSKNSAEITTVYPEN